MQRIPIVSSLIARLSTAAGTRRLTDIAAGAVALALVIAVAAKAADLTWRLLPAGEASTEAATPALEHAGVPQRAVGASVGERIAGWHLFGEPSTEAPAVEPTPIDAPETGLDLALKGVLFSPDPPHARAIIAGPEGRDSHYAVGDELPGGARLERVYRDRVILRRQGRLEALRLPRTEQGLAVDETAEAGDARSARYLARFQEQLRERPGALAAQFQFERVERDGRLVGFRLRGGPEGQALEHLDIRAGDVITAVNGIALDNPGNLVKIMNEATNAERLSVTLLREGQRVSRDYRIGR